MHRLALVCLALLTSCASRHPWKHALYLQAGGRQHKQDFEPVDDEFVYGLEYTARPAEGALGLEVGASYGTSDETGTASVDGTSATGDFDLTIAEVYVGPRFTFECGPARPFFGTGVSYLFGDLDYDVDGTSASAEDQTFAGYVHGGSDFLIGKHFSLGVDLRYLFAADFEEASVRVDGDALQLAGRIGWSF